MAANTITIVTIVVATDTTIADSFACVITAQAIAVAIAGAARMASPTVATAVTAAIAAAVTTTTTTTTTTILRVGGAHDGQASGQ